MKIPEVRDVLEIYENGFDNRMREMNAYIPEYSEISHESIVARALLCRKPFRESDKGYRDTLLWKTILNKISAEDRVVYFITNNSDDFCVSKDNPQLHQYLRDDLKNIGLKEDSVQIYLNLKLFLEGHIIHQFKEMTQQADKMLQSGEYQNFSVLDWFCENRESFVYSANNWVASLFSGSMLEDPEIRYIEDPDDINVKNVAVMDEHLRYVNVSVWSDIVVEVFVHKSNYYYLYESGTLEVIDEDWNEHYIFGQVNIKLPINFSILLNIINEQVEQYEINPLQDVFGWCSHCRYPVLSDASELCTHCGKSLLLKSLLR